MGGGWASKWLANMKEVDGTVDKGFGVLWYKNDIKKGFILNGARGARSGVQVWVWVRTARNVYLS